jgi:hypothetical protein
VFPVEVTVAAAAAAAVGVLSCLIQQCLVATAMLTVFVLSAKGKTTPAQAAHLLMNQSRGVYASAGSSDRLQSSRTSYCWFAVTQAFMLKGAML